HHETAHRDCGARARGSCRNEPCLGGGDDGELDPRRQPPARTDDGLMRNGSPSGEQIEIRAGGHHAVVVEVGAGLRAYVVADRPVLDAYGPDELASAGRGQVLMPWPNRIQDGAYEFAGTWYHLPLTEPGARNAIHGLVRWAPWSIAERASDRVVMEL